MKEGLGSGEARDEKLAGRVALEILTASSIEPPEIDETAAVPPVVVMPELRELVR